MSIGPAIAVGAVIGLALGIVISLTTDVPLAPEVGLVLGVLGGWLVARGSNRSTQ
jgi:predicted ABC-type sugar transport system permease subunit